MKDFEVTICNPQRAKEWQEHLGTTTVYVKSPIAILANLPGKPGSWVYELDIELLTDEQRKNLVIWLAGKFGLSMELALAEFERAGVPILAEDVRLTIYNPERWL